MTAWFDVVSLGENVVVNEYSMLCAVEKIHKFIDEELAKSGLPSEDLLMAGFSQGGALALYAALTYHKTLSGVLFLSSWLPLHVTFPKVIYMLYNFNN